MLRSAEVHAYTCTACQEVRGLGISVSDVKCGKHVSDEVQAPVLHAFAGRCHTQCIATFPKILWLLSKLKASHCLLLQVPSRDAFLIIQTSHCLLLNVPSRDAFLIIQTSHCLLLQVPPRDASGAAGRHLLYCRRRECGAGRPHWKWQELHFPHPFQVNTAARSAACSCGMPDDHNLHPFVSGSSACAFLFALKLFALSCSKMLLGLLASHTA